MLVYTGLIIDLLGNTSFTIAFLSLYGLITINQDISYFLVVAIAVFMVKSLMSLIYNLSNKGVISLKYMNTFSSAAILPLGLMSVFAIIYNLKLLVFIANVLIPVSAFLAYLVIFYCFENNTHPMAKNFISSFILIFFGGIVSFEYLAFSGKFPWLFLICSGFALVYRLSKTYNDFTFYKNASVSVRAINYMYGERLETNLPIGPIAELKYTYEFADDRGALFLATTAQLEEIKKIDEDIADKVDDIIKCLISHHIPKAFPVSFKNITDAYDYSSLQEYIAKGQTKDPYTNKPMVLSELYLGYSDKAAKGFFELILKLQKKYIEEIFGIESSDTVDSLVEKYKVKRDIINNVTLEENEQYCSYW